jgi:hypothetical protein
MEDHVCNIFAEEGEFDTAGSCSKKIVSARQLRKTTLIKRLSGTQQHGGTGADLDILYVSSARCLLSLNSLKTKKRNKLQSSTENGC